ncbi:MAG: hypothetical protein IAG10_11295 [Planctomycetaceae bacterium]|nr:hypothetical protein [Planctomycetaceae bacterium]
MTTLTATLPSPQRIAPVADHQLIASERARALLAGNGLTSLEAVFDCGDPLPGARETFGNRHPNRGVVHTTLHGDGTSLRVFIKKQWRHERWIPRWNELWDGTAFLAMPAREWRGLNLLRAIGLDTAEPLALFTGGRFSARAAIVTCAVPAERDLLEMIEAGHLDRLPAADRQGLAQEIAVVIQRIHGAGYGWRSLKPKHLFPLRQSDGRWRIWLIDCETVQTRPTPKQALRERRRFLEQLAELGVSADFRETISRNLSQETSKS